MANRFDYVRYDNIAQAKQNGAKEICMQLEKYIESRLPDSNPRPKEYALAKLEEVYMWIGKAIRDEQVRQVEGRVAELQEERSNE